jgi:hypothetical protein
MAEGLRAAIRPDFAAIEAMESEVASQIGRTSSPLSVEERERRAAKARDTRERNRLARMTPAQRGAETRAKRATVTVPAQRTSSEDRVAV